LKNKLNIVFLVDNYYPKFSPVAKCAYNIAKEMSNQYNVTVITLDGDKEEGETEVIDNHSVKRGYISTFFQRKKCTGKVSNSNKVKSIFNKVEMLFIRAKSYLKANISRVNINQEIVECYLKHMNGIDIDVIIPVCLPFESVVAACNYKEKNSQVMILPFLFDRFTNNKSLHRNAINRKLKRKAHLLLEKNMIISADHIFAMHQLKANFENMFPQDIKSFSFIEHPLLCNINLPNPTCRDNITRLIYAGALYKKYRSPNYALKIFELIKGDFILDFYSAGNCEDVIDEYSKMKNSKIRSHGYVSVEELEIAYANTDILISIGNFRSHNMASKIFEYMSIGKPIIHFYEIDQDPVLNVLDKYPLALLIKQDEKNIYENAKKIQKFIEENKEKQIEYKKIAEVFNDATPNTVMTYFEEQIARRNFTYE